MVCERLDRNGAKKAFRDSALLQEASTFDGSSEGQARDSQHDVVQKTKRESRRSVFR